MKKLKLILLLLLVGLFSCTEDITIDLEEGSPLIGVEGSFTDEFKRHEVILSYTADFYNSDEIRMITGARVVVTDGVDTIPYFEQPDQPGHYLRSGWRRRRKDPADVFVFGSALHFLSI